MKEVCIPLPYLSCKEFAEVHVSIVSRGEEYCYRIESLPWTADKDSENLIEEGFDRKISGLKKSIDTYDHQWELLQIFSPEPGAKHIHVLFRKKIVH